MERDFDSSEQVASESGQVTSAMPCGTRRTRGRAASAVRCHRSCDTVPGYARRRTDYGFEYLNLRGRLIKDARVIARIDSLTIPPAWTDVWICADPHGHLQATGRDARGRKQYRYHPIWREQQESQKFARIASFAHALPQIRAAVERDLALGGLPKEKVVAAIVRLLDRTLARIGGAEYARDNATYGLTTLCKRHVRFGPRAAMLRFRGKHGIMHEIEVNDALVLGVMRACQVLPGRALFAYREDAMHHCICADDVNEYLQQTANCAITAKDFRTWGASVATLALLSQLEPPVSDRAATRALVAIIRDVAALLKNTPAVCRRSYVHPWVLDAFRSCALALLRKRAGKSALSPAERAFALLIVRRSRSQGAN